MKRKEGGRRESAREVFQSIEERREKEEEVRGAKSNPICFFLPPSELLLLSVCVFCPLICVC